MRFSNSPARCWALPMPALAKVSAPGFARASASSPAASLKRPSAATTSP